MKDIVLWVFEEDFEEGVEDWITGLGEYFTTDS
jgi:hypothetical protein